MADLMPNIPADLPPLPWTITTVADMLLLQDRNGQTFLSCRNDNRRAESHFVYIAAAVAAYTAQIQRDQEQRNG